jgi:uncharacterized protein YciI
MIAVELSFSTDPARLSARPAHREVLQRLRDAGKLVLAGPWSDDSGALLLFDVDDAGLDEIIADDRYYRTPGVTLIARRHWNPLPLG